MSLENGFLKKVLNASILFTSLNLEDSKTPVFGNFAVLS